MGDLLVILFASSVSIAVFGTVGYYYIKERKTWNKGICKECNKEWIFHGYDFYGERVYMTDDYEHMCKISFRTIDKHEF